MCSSGIEKKIIVRFIKNAELQTKSNGCPYECLSARSLTGALDARFKGWSMDTLDEQLDELVQSMMTARANYDIWWIYKNDTDRQKYINALNEFPEFFRVGIHAHFVAMIMALYKLYDKRADVISIPTLLTEAAKHSWIPSQLISSITLKIDEIEVIFKKLKTLRHKLFAHRDKNIDYKQLFADVAITYDEIRLFIDHTLCILNKLLYNKRRTNIEFPTFAVEDTYKLLETLRQICS